MNTASTTDVASSPATISPRPKSFVLALCLASVLLIWSFNFVAGKIALRHIDALSLASLRVELSAFLILPIYFWKFRRRTPVRPHHIGTFFYLGFFGVFINMGCFTVGLSETTSEHSVVIMALGPILVLLLACLLKLEKLTTAKSVGMMISFVGVILLETEHRTSLHSPFLLGDLITLCSISGFALYATLAKRVVAGYDALSMNTYNILAAAILMLPFAVWRGIQLDWESVGWVGWAGMLYMSGCSTVLSYTLFNWVLRYMDPSRVAAVNYIEPIIVILISIPLLGEHPTGHLLSGAVLVLLGVYFAEHVGLADRLGISEGPH
ncbi:MAG TPA: DMT family transporter [Candidatus Acidoferrales bacterium]|nr:DMT family transporter [Candidatus Acidoferrales bacterium]